MISAYASRIQEAFNPLRAPSPHAPEALARAERALKALGIKAELPRQIKVLSFIATPSRVKPITTAKRRGDTVARAATIEI
jgi:hypothetical protein